MAARRARMTSTGRSRSADNKDGLRPGWSEAVEVSAFHSDDELLPLSAAQSDSRTIRIHRTAEQDQLTQSADFDAPAAIASRGTAPRRLTRRAITHYSPKASEREKHSSETNTNIPVLSIWRMINMLRVRPEKLKRTMFPGLKRAKNNQAIRRSNQLCARQESGAVPPRRID